MPRDKAIVASVALKQNDVAQNFVTIANATKHIQRELHLCFRLTQRHVLFENDFVRSFVRRRGDAPKTVAAQSQGQRRLVLASPNRIVFALPGGSRAQLLDEGVPECD